MNRHHRPMGYIRPRHHHVANPTDPTEKPPKPPPVPLGHVHKPGIPLAPMVGFAVVVYLAIVMVATR